MELMRSRVIQIKSPKMSLVEFSGVMARTKIEILVSPCPVCMWQFGRLLMESRSPGRAWSPGKIYINQTQTDSVA